MDTATMSPEDAQFIETRRGMTPRYEIQQTRDPRYTPLAIVEIWPDGQQTPMHMFHFSYSGTDEQDFDIFREECQRLDDNARPL